MKFIHEGKALLTLPMTGRYDNGTECEGCVADNQNLPDGKKKSIRKALCRDLPPCSKESGGEFKDCIFVPDTPANRVLYMAHMLTR